jgi:hypothetical protein
MQTEIPEKLYRSVPIVLFMRLRLLVDFASPPGSPLYSYFLTAVTFSF